MDHWKPNSRYEHAFTIVRVDSWAGVDAKTEPEVAITVKRVVRTQEIA